MPDVWTGEIVGQMHLNRITVQELADEVHVARTFLSSVLNGSRRMPDAEERCRAAMQRIIQRRRE